MGIEEILGKHLYTFPFKVEKVNVNKIVPDFFPGEFDDRLHTLFDYRVGEKYIVSVWENVQFIKSEKTGEIYFIPKYGDPMMVEGDLIDFILSIKPESREDIFVRLLAEGRITAKAKVISSSRDNNFAVLEVRMMEDSKWQSEVMTNILEVYYISVGLKDGTGIIVEGAYNRSTSQFYSKRHFKNLKEVKLPKSILGIAQLPESVFSNTLFALDYETMMYIRKHCSHTSKN